MPTQINPIRSLIQGIGIAWGVLLFGIGVIGSFTFNSVHLISSLLVLVFGFLIILPITIVAFWRPKMAAIAVTVAFVITVCSVWAAGTARDAAKVGSKLIIPDAMLVCGYGFLSYVLRNSG